MALPAVSVRRKLTSLFYRRKIRMLDKVNLNVDFLSMIRERFLNSLEHSDREAMYASVHPDTTAIDYLEFGVYQGESMQVWADLNTHPDSRFVGFDSFEGLPEDWTKGKPAGTFDAGGKTPAIPDPRVR